MVGPSFASKCAGCQSAMPGSALAQAGKDDFGGLVQLNSAVR